jgi:hypothetical protein
MAFGHSSACVGPPPASIVCLFATANPLPINARSATLARSRMSGLAGRESRGQFPERRAPALLGPSQLGTRFLSVCPHARFGKPFVQGMQALHFRTHGSSQVTLPKIPMHGEKGEAHDRQHSEDRKPGQQGDLAGGDDPTTMITVHPITTPTAVHRTGIKRRRSGPSLASVPRTAATSCWSGKFVIFSAYPAYVGYRSLSARSACTSQFRRRLAQTFEAALDCVAGAAVGVKRRAIHALEIGLDQSDIVQNIQKSDSRAIRRRARLPAQSRP